MATYVKYQKGIEMMAEAGNAQTDTWKLLLSNTTPDVVNNTTAASITEISGTNGYTTGGASVTVASAAQTGGTFKLTLTIANPTWTSSTGNMGPFQYVILYNLTNTQVVAYWDYGSALTLNGVNGDTFTPVISAEVFSIA